MTRFSALIAVVLALSGTVFAAEDIKPAMDLPIYQGGAVSLELNLTNEDFLPLLEAALPMFGRKLGPVAEKIDPNEVAAILKDMKRLEFVEVRVEKPNVREADLVSFYSEHLPEGAKWSRALYQSSPKGTMALYVRDGVQGIYGYRVWSSVEDGKTVRRAMVGKTEGKIDFARLVALAGKLFTM